MEDLRLNDYVKECYAIARSKGWHEGSSNPLEVLALIHSEVSEAVECVRRDEWGFCLDSGTGKPVGLESELADILIRVFSWAGELGVDLDGVVQRKMAFNRTRSYKHGGKRY